MTATGKAPAEEGNLEQRINSETAVGGRGGGGDGGWGIGEWEQQQQEQIQNK